MTISVQTLAALALDVYNRGVNEAYVYDSSVNSINDFVFTQGEAREGGANQFFAGIYEDDAGAIVISYRGTDQYTPEVTGDALSVALGLANPQILEALRVYDEIASDPANAGKTIYLTGHSLGGALAGIVAALRGTPALNNELSGSVTTLAGAHVFDAANIKAALNTLKVGGAWFEVPVGGGSEVRYSP